MFAFIPFDTEGASTNIDLNDSSLGLNETSTGGIFSNGISFTRWFTLTTFGVGLPSNTPTWMVTIFIAWQSLITIMALGFVVSSIWNG